MKEKIKEIIKVLFGTKENITFKLSCSAFITGVFFCMLAMPYQNNDTQHIYDICIIMSALSFSIWIILIQGKNTAMEVFYEFSRLFVFFFILILSLQFYLDLITVATGIKLYIFSFLSFLGLISCSFYFVSKFIDIFNFVKKVFNQVKIKLFNTIQSEETEHRATKLKSFIENITTFLISIAGLGVAIKTIIEPLLNLFQP